MRTGRSPSEYREVLTSCLEETQHLVSINETVLLLARLDSGEWSPTPVTVDLRELVEAAVQRARSRGGDHGFRVLPSETVAVSAFVDSKLIRVVLDRLLDNTIEHTPAGTQVQATVAHVDSTVVFTIEDDGPGLPEDELPHLFDRFYRVDPARPRATGAGLGLSIAAAVAQAHNGSIRAETGGMGGLRVTMVLPRTTD